MYKRTSFRRRGAANAAGKEGTDAAAGTPPADAAPAAAPETTPAKDS
ncbi:hypothetical protein [Azospirillum himalayense]|uniref:Uncharacterized protein n=1 Tax=Azospirillum himalayense TaxID=654847 RepID=A0ABW0G015_9PROT